MKDMLHAKVTQRDTDDWQFRGRYENGKAFRRVGFATKKEATAALNLFLFDVRKQEKTPKTEVTVAVWLDKWLDIMSLTTRATTIAGYRGTVEARIVPHIGDIKLQDLDEDDCRSYYKKMVALGYGTNTIKGAHMRLRAALRCAVREHKIEYSPLENVTPPKGKPPRDRKVWSFDEAQKFLSHVSVERDAALWTFWLTTGLRRGETCGLQWSSVDLDNGFATIDFQRTLTEDGKISEGDVKTESGKRTVYLDAGTVQALRVWKSAQSAIRLEQGPGWRGGDYVFTSRRNTPYNPHSFNSRLENLAAAAGLPRLTPHELRHTFATRADESGMAVSVLSQVLGHSSVTTTIDMYIHPSSDQVKAESIKATARMFG
jgi:integrase